MLGSYYVEENEVISFAATWKQLEIITVKKQQLEPDMEQWTGSKFGKEYIKSVYCHPVYLISMQTWSVTQSRPTLCDPMDCSMPGFPVFHYLPEFVQTHIL